MKTIKSVLKVILDDIKQENFTKSELVKYGIVMPLALVAVCVLAEVINHL